MLGFFEHRENLFHKLIEDQAALTYEGLDLLLKYFESGESQVAILTVRGLDEVWEVPALGPSSF